MGLHEYRAPSAFGGLTTAWIYREDLMWLIKRAKEASAWMSASGREVRFDAADMMHELVEARRAQGELLLRPERPVWPRFCPQATPRTEKPAKRRPGPRAGH